MDDDMLDDLIGTDEEDVLEEPVAEVEEEEAPAAKAEEPATEEPEGKVDIRALHEARQQNRELREQLAAAAAQQARLDEIQKRLDAMAKPPAAPEPEIEFDEDPKGYIDKQVSTAKAAAEAAQAKTNEMEQTSAQQAAINRLNQDILSDHQAAVAKHADYLAALNYSREVRSQELLDAGFTELQAKQAVNNEELQMAAVALQNGKSPSEVAYNRSLRWGFKPADAVKAEPEAGEDKPDIGDAASMGSGNVPSVQDLLEATEDEFDLAFKELGYGDRMK